MPINATIEFSLAEKEYNEAQTIEEKIRGIEKMLATAPTHKGAENLRSNLQLRLSKLKKQVDLEKKQKGGNRHQISVKKEGAAQIVIIGVTNSGKSTLLQKLTKAKAAISEHPFTTKKPEIGIMNYNGIQIQVVEIPAVFKDFMKGERGPMFLGIIRQADLVIFLLRDNLEQEFELLTKELNKANIKFNMTKSDNEYDYATYIKGVIVLNGEGKFGKGGFNIIKFDDPNLIKKIWPNLEMVYVYTKSPGKKKDYPPVALKKGSMIKDLADIIHKDFLSKFKYAKVWGVSAKFKNGQVVGLNHILQEEDVVELHLK